MFLCISNFQIITLNFFVFYSIWNIIISLKFYPLVNYLSCINNVFNHIQMYLWITLALHSVIFLSGLRNYGMPGIELGLVMCKLNALITVLSLQYLIRIYLKSTFLEKKIGIVYFGVCVFCMYVISTKMFINLKKSYTVVVLVILIDAF